MTSLEEAIEILHGGGSLRGRTIEAFEDRRVSGREALLLSAAGVVVPEGNIDYLDEEVEYDPEFDDATWTRLPAGITLEEQINMAREHERRQKVVYTLTTVLDLEDDAVKVWVEKNHEQIKTLLNRFVTDIYNSREILE